MKLEEAIKRRDGGENCFNLISEIFEEFQMMTCSNCKYSDLEDELYHCGNPADDMQLISYVDKDFGCNKWEQK